MNTKGAFVLAHSEYFRAFFTCSFARILQKYYVLLSSTAIDAFHSQSTTTGVIHEILSHLRRAFQLPVIAEGNGKIPFYDKIRLQLCIFGKALAQHIRWEAGEDERGEREITLSQIKSQSVIFRSNCLEPLLDTAKNCVCICIYFAIHWCTSLWAQSTGTKPQACKHALFVWMGEGLQPILQRHFAICHSSQQIWGDGVNTSYVCPVEAHSALH